MTAVLAEYKLKFFMMKFMKAISYRISDITQVIFVSNLGKNFHFL